LAQLFDTGIFSALTPGAAIGAGWKVAFYQAGTTTEATTYADADLATPNANPVVADANGRFPAIWLGTGSYKYQLLTSADVPVVTRDDLTVDAPPPTFAAGLDDFLEGDAALPVASGGTGSTTAADARAALAVLGTAGGTITGNITRSGKGAHAYFASSSMTSPIIHLTASAASDPRAGNPGEVWLKY
jgi:hypothetical protein